MLVGGEGNTLIISDMHLPYHHKDALEFLDTLNGHYGFDRVLNVGDLYDHHRGSYHESEMDAFSEEKEFSRARKAAHDLQDIFPDMVITEGNHDCIPMRKAKTLGLSAGMIKNYNEMYDTGYGWQWVQEHWFDSWGAFPITHPMVLNKRGRWDKCILKL
jgi:UDP-2,3-diacylglucosamine pyrophosphatase LpxH